MQTLIRSLADVIKTPIIQGYSFHSLANIYFVVRHSPVSF